MNPKIIIEFLFNIWDLIYINNIFGVIKSDYIWVINDLDILTRKSEYVKDIAEYITNKELKNIEAAKLEVLIEKKWKLHNYKKTLYFLDILIDFVKGGKNFLLFDYIFMFNDYFSYIPSIFSIILKIIEFILYIINFLLNLVYPILEFITYLNEYILYNVVIYIKESFWWLGNYNIISKKYKTNINYYLDYYYNYKLESYLELSNHYSFLSDEFYFDNQRSRLIMNVMPDVNRYITDYNDISKEDYTNLGINTHFNFFYLRDGKKDPNDTDRFIWDFGIYDSLLLKDIKNINNNILKDLNKISFSKRYNSIKNTTYNINNVRNVLKNDSFFKGNIIFFLYDRYEKAIELYHRPFFGDRVFKSLKKEKFQINKKDLSYHGWVKFFRKTPFEKFFPFRRFKKVIYNPDLTLIKNDQYSLRFVINKMVHFNKQLIKWRFISSTEQLFRTDNSSLNAYHSNSAYLLDVKQKLHRRNIVWYENYRGYDYYYKKHFKYRQLLCQRFFVKKNWIKRGNDNTPNLYLWLTTRHLDKELIDFWLPTWLIKPTKYTIDGSMFGSYRHWWWLYQDLTENDQREVLYRKKQLRRYFGLHKYIHWLVKPEDSFISDDDLEVIYKDPRYGKKIEPWFYERWTDSFLRNTIPNLWFWKMWRRIRVLGIYDAFATRGLIYLPKSGGAGGYRFHKYFLEFDYPRYYWKLKPLSMFDPRKNMGFKRDYMFYYDMFRVKGSKFKFGFYVKRSLYHSLEHNPRLYLRNKLWWYPTKMSDKVDIFLFRKFLKMYYIGVSRVLSKMIYNDKNLVFKNVKAVYSSLGFRKKTGMTHKLLGRYIHNQWVWLITIKSPYKKAYPIQFRPYEYVSAIYVKKPGRWGPAGYYDWARWIRPEKRSKYWVSIPVDWKDTKQLDFTDLTKSKKRSRYPYKVGKSIRKRLILLDRKQRSYLKWYSIVLNHIVLKNFAKDFWAYRDILLYKAQLRHAKFLFKKIYGFIKLDETYDLNIINTELQTKLRNNQYKMKFFLSKDKFLKKRIHNFFGQNIVPIKFDTTFFGNIFDQDYDKYLRIILKYHWYIYKLLWLKEIIIENYHYYKKFYYIIQSLIDIVENSIYLPYYDSSLIYLHSSHIYREEWWLIKYYYRSLLMQFLAPYVIQFIIWCWGILKINIFLFFKIIILFIIIAFYCTIVFYVIAALKSVIPINSIYGLRSSSKNKIYWYKSKLKRILYSKIVKRSLFFDLGVEEAKAFNKYFLFKSKDKKESMHTILNTNYKILYKTFVFEKSLKRLENNARGRITIRRIKIKKVDDYRDLITKHFPELKYELDKELEKSNSNLKNLEEKIKSEKGISFYTNRVFEITKKIASNDKLFKKEYRGGGIKKWFYLWEKLNKKSFLFVFYKLVQTYYRDRIHNHGKRLRWLDPNTMEERGNIIYYYVFKSNKKVTQTFYWYYFIYRLLSFIDVKYFQGKWKIKNVRNLDLRVNIKAVRKWAKMNFKLHELNNDAEDALNDIYHLKLLEARHFWEEKKLDLFYPDENIKLGSQTLNFLINNKKLDIKKFGQKDIDLLIKNEEKIRYFWWRKSLRNRYNFKKPRAAYQDDMFIRDKHGNKQTNYSQLKLELERDLRYKYVDNVLRAKLKEINADYTRKRTKLINRQNVWAKELLQREKLVSLKAKLRLDTFPVMKVLRSIEAEKDRKVVRAHYEKTIRIRSYGKVDLDQKIEDSDSTYYFNIPAYVKELTLGFNKIDFEEQVSLREDRKKDLKNLLYKDILNKFTYFRWFSTIGARLNYFWSVILTVYQLWNHSAVNSKKYKWEELNIKNIFKISFISIYNFLIKIYWDYIILTKNYRAFKHLGYSLKDILKFSIFMLPVSIILVLLYIYFLIRYYNKIKYATWKIKKKIIISKILKENIIYIICKKILSIINNIFFIIWFLFVDIKTGKSIFNLLYMKIYNLLGKIQVSLFFLKGAYDLGLKEKGKKQGFLNILKWIKLRLVYYFCYFLDYIRINYKSIITISYWINLFKLNRLYIDILLKINIIFYLTNIRPKKVKLKINKFIFSNFRIFQNKFVLNLLALINLNVPFKIIKSVWTTVLSSKNKSFSNLTLNILIFFKIFFKLPFLKKIKLLWKFFLKIITLPLYVILKYFFIINKKVNEEGLTISKRWGLGKLIHYICFYHILSNSVSNLNHHVFVIEEWVIYQSSKFTESYAKSVWRQMYKEAFFNFKYKYIEYAYDFFFYWENVYNTFEKNPMTNRWPLWKRIWYLRVILKLKNSFTYSFEQEGKEISRELFLLDKRAKYIRYNIIYFLKAVINWISFILKKKAIFTEISELKGKVYKSKKRRFRYVKYKSPDMSETVFIGTYLYDVPPELWILVYLNHFYYRLVLFYLLDADIPVKEGPGVSGTLEHKWRISPRASVPRWLGHRFAVSKKQLGDPIMFAEGITQNPYDPILRYFLQAVEAFIVTEEYHEHPVWLDVSLVFLNTYSVDLDKLKYEGKLVYEYHDIKDHLNFVNDLQILYKNDVEKLLIELSIEQDRVRKGSMYFDALFNINKHMKLDRENYWESQRRMMFERYGLEDELDKVKLGGFPKPREQIYFEVKELESYLLHPKYNFYDEESGEKETTDKIDILFYTLELVEYLSYEYTHSEILFDLKSFILFGIDEESNVINLINMRFNGEAVFDQIKQYLEASVPDHLYELRELTRYESKVQAEREFYHLNDNARPVLLPPLYNEDRNFVFNKTYYNYNESLKYFHETDQLEIEESAWAYRWLDKWRLDIYRGTTSIAERYKTELASDYIYDMNWVFLRIQNIKCSWEQWLFFDGFEQEVQELYELNFLIFNEKRRLWNLKHMPIRAKFHIGVDVDLDAVKAFKGIWLAKCRGVNYRYYVSGFRPRIFKGANWIVFQNELKERYNVDPVTFFYDIMNPIYENNPELKKFKEDNEWLFYKFASRVNKFSALAFLSYNNFFKDLIRWHWNWATLDYQDFEYSEYMGIKEKEVVRADKLVREHIDDTHNIVFHRFSPHRFFSFYWKRRSVMIFVLNTCKIIFFVWTMNLIYYHPGEYLRYWTYLLYPTLAFLAFWYLKRFYKAYKYLFYAPSLYLYRFQGKVVKPKFLTKIFTSKEDMKAYHEHKINDKKGSFLKATRVSKKINYFDFIIFMPTFYVAVLYFIVDGENNMRWEWQHVYPTDYLWDYYEENLLQLIEWKPGITGSNAWVDRLWDYDCWMRIESGGTLFSNWYTNIFRGWQHLPLKKLDEGYDFILIHPKDYRLNFRYGGFNNFYFTKRMWFHGNFTDIVWIFKCNSSEHLYRKYSYSSKGITASLRFQGKNYTDLGFYIEGVIKVLKKNMKSAPHYMSEWLNKKWFEAAEELRKAKEPSKVTKKILKDRGFDWDNQRSISSLRYELMVEIPQEKYYIKNFYHRFIINSRRGLNKQLVKIRNQYYDGVYGERAKNEISDKKNFYSIKLKAFKKKTDVPADVVLSMSDDERFINLFWLQQYWYKLKSMFYVRESYVAFSWKASDALIIYKKNLILQIPPKRPWWFLIKPRHSNYRRSRMKVVSFDAIDDIIYKNKKIILKYCLKHLSKSQKLINYKEKSIEQLKKSKKLVKKKHKISDGWEIIPEVDRSKGKLNYNWKKAKHMLNYYNKKAQNKQELINIKGKGRGKSINAKEKISSINAKGKGKDKSINAKEKISSINAKGKLDREKLLQEIKEKGKSINAKGKDIPIIDRGKLLQEIKERRKLINAKGKGKVSITERNNLWKEIKVKKKSLINYENMPMSQYKELVKKNIVRIRKELYDFITERPKFYEKKIRKMYHSGDYYFHYVKSIYRPIKFGKKISYKVELITSYLEKDFLSISSWQKVYKIVKEIDTLYEIASIFIEVIKYFIK